MKRWWFTAIVVFSLMFVLILDLLTYFVDETTTISYNIQEWCGGNPETLRAGALGFVMGALLVHFTGWSATPPKKTP